MAQECTRGVPPPTVVVQGFRSFPSNANAHAEVVYANVAEDAGRQSLCHLAEMVQDLLEAAELHVARFDEGYVPHVTLACT